MANVKLTALQPIRAGDTTYRPGEEFAVDEKAADRLVGKGHAVRVQVKEAAGKKSRSETRSRKAQDKEAADDEGEAENGEG